MENTNQKNFDKARKKNIKKYALWAALALMVLILTVMPLMAKNDVEEDGPVASILSGTVETGSVTTALHGGGTLSADNAEDVTIPASVKITEFLVKNGQEVTEGTPLATVDKVSVMNAIVELTQTLEYLQDEIESTRNETVSSYVNATAGGLVKEVYAQAGDSVQDVMLEHGALAVLSLDGKLAVDIQRNMDILTGDSVAVALSDGTEVTGRVESNLDGLITISIEDDGYEVGQEVIVTTDDGDKVGTGQLYIHNAWKAAAFTGTISTVYAKEDNTVYSGATLFTLTDTDFTAQMENLATQHREYEELMQKLFNMYESGTINAPCDGVISGIDKDSTHLLAAEETEVEAELLDTQTESGSEKGWSIVLLSNVQTAEETIPCTGDKNCQLPHDSTEHLETCIQACDRSTACDAKVHHSNCIKACDHADKDEDCDATVHYYDCIKSCVKADEEGECNSEKHYSNCIESCIISDGSADCPATGAHHSDCIEMCDLSENCPGTKNHYAACITLCDESLQCDAINHKTTCPLYGVSYTACAAKVTAAGNELVVLLDSVTVYKVSASKTGWTLVEPASLRTDLMLYETTVQPSNKAQCSAGDIILIMTGTDQSGNVIEQNKVIVYRQGQQSGQGGEGSMGGMGGMSGMGGMAGMSGMMSGMSGMIPGMTGSTGTTTTTQELFDLEGDVLMTVTPRNTACITITVDEQDISEVSLGQAAEVQVEALKGEVFEAEVTQIATIGTNNGGSSKFDVELKMSMEGDMLDGMSATASIPLYTKMDVLTIPVAALVEDGAQTVVYTALDKETGNPTSPVVVEIGVSDGETAEILSGLNSGDTYYYSYYDTLELSTAVESGGFSPFGR